MRRTIAAGALMALLAATPAEAGERRAYTRAYYEVVRECGLKAAGPNLRRGGASTRRLAAHAPRLRRQADGCRPWAWVTASWYGPGLYGNPMACGGRLTTGTLGVAHKGLPCGTRIELRRGGRRVTVRVVDRGPFVAGRTFDLTAATARALGFGGVGTVGWRMAR